MIMLNSDVKPANFMTGLPDSAESDTVFLVDFGVATRFLGTFTLRSNPKHCTLNRVLYVYAVAMRSLRCELPHISSAKLAAVSCTYVCIVPHHVACSTT
jgi:hypothetical protein